MTELRTEVSRVDAGDYVLPKPPRAVEFPLQIATSGQATAGLRRAEAARMLGDRSLALVECHQQFLAEVRERLVTLDVAIAEDSRAQLKGALRAALEVLDWCDAVQVDLQREAGLARLGYLPHDLATLCAEVASAHTGGVVLIGGSAHGPWWGDGALLAATLEAAVALIRERTGGRGAVVLEVAEADGVHSVRVASQDDVVDEVEAETAHRFRGLATRAGIAVLHDRLGVGAPGMVLRLPVSQAV